MRGRRMTFRWRNRLAWNEATSIHVRARRERPCEHVLAAVELRELGAVRGRSIVHLQCNCGQDALALARMGADVCGVDISDAAISEARRLARKAGLRVQFTRADVFDYDPGRKFDIVYTGKGALYWMDDIRRWASRAARLLRPGGRLYVYEDHPFLSVLLEMNPTEYNKAAGTIDYFHSPKPIKTVGLDYIGFSGEGSRPCFEWQWTLGDIVSAVVDAGLRLDFLREWPFTSGCRYWPHLRWAGGAYRIPKGYPQLPLSFSLQATLDA